MSRKMRRFLKSFLALFLVIVLGAGSLASEPAFYLEASETGGFDIGISWANNAEDAVDSSFFDYTTDASENREIRLNISYSNKDITDTYDAGSVAITVPGIAGAMRSGSLQASSIAADKAASTSKEYAWSYTYNASSDTYTFTNNNRITPSTTFAGYFEIIWTVNSRNSFTDYSQAMQAVLRTGNIEIKSNQLTYKQSRTDDNFSLTLSANQRSSYAGEGLNASLNPDDYWWVFYDGTSRMQVNSLGVESSYIDVLVPVGAEIRYTGDVGYYNTKVTEVIGGVTYSVWRVNQSVHNSSSNALNLLIIYPKSDFPAGNYVDIWMRSKGNYYDHGRGVETLAETKAQAIVSEYEFPTRKPDDEEDENGDDHVISLITRVDKTAVGMGRNTDFAKNYSSTANKNGYIDSRHIENGKRAYDFTIYTNVAYPMLLDPELNTYDLDITDEELSVRMLDGTYRQMKSGEYEIQTITIPSGSTILNQTNNPIYKTIQVYIKQDGDTTYKKYNEYTPGSGDRTITLPEGVTGVRFVMEELQESIYIAIPLTVIFHSQDDRINLESGELVNRAQMHYTAYYKSTPAQEALTAAPSASAVVPAEHETSMTASQEDNDSQSDHETENETEGEPEPAETVENNEEPERDLEAVSEMDGDFDERDSEAEPDLEEQGTVPEEPDETDQTDSVFDGERDQEADAEIISEEPEPAKDAAAYSQALPVNQGAILEREVEMEAIASLDIIKVPNFYYHTVSLAKFGDYSVVQNGVPSEVTLRTDFTYQDSENLSEFSMYTILPDNMKLSNTIKGLDYLYEQLSIVSNLGLTEKELEKALTITMEENYQNSGRIMLRFAFSFDTPLFEPSGYIYVKFPVSAGGYNIFRYGADFTVRGISVIEDEDVYIVPSSGNALNDGAYAPESEAGLWSGLAQGKSTADVISHKAATQTKSTTAIAIEIGLTKLVATETEGNQYTVTDVNADGSYVEDEILLAELGTRYSYRLRMSPVVDLNMSHASDIIFMDSIETAPGAEWTGTFESVDVSDAELLLSVENERDIKAAIYYSEKDFSDVMYQSGYKPDFQSADWSSTIPDQVRTIAVSFGDAQITDLYPLEITINMRAPEDEEYLYQITENKAVTYYDAVAKDGQTTAEWLPSNLVPVKLMPEMIKIIIEKVDGDTQEGLAGAVFDLYELRDPTLEPKPEDDILIRSGLTTDAKGRLIIRNLPIEDYYLVETDAPGGYERIGKWIPLEIDLSGGETEFAFQIENTKKPGVIELFKKSDLGENIPVPGAVFELYNSLGVSMGQYETQEDGRIRIEDLEWGSYYFVEISSPDGYADPDSNQHYPFVINAQNDAGRDLDVIEVINEQIPASVKLNKYVKLENGEETQTPLEGAIFALYRVSESGEDEYLGNYITDQNGEIQVDDLLFGEYYFIETFAPRGYYRIGDQGEEPEIDFELHADYSEENPYALTVYDQMRYGSVLIQKRDETNAEVEGAEYTLYKYNEETEDYEVYVPSGLSESYENPLRTDNNGIITYEKLEWGKYKVNETAAPMGYELDLDEYEFEIGPATVYSVYQLDVSDQRSKGQVRLIKIREGGSEDRAEDRLKGAVFQLLRSDGTLVYDGLTTDDDGVIEVTGLEWGSYYFEETKAPDGYGLTTEKVRFTVNYISASAMQELVVTNPSEEKYLEITKRIDLDDLNFANGNPTFIFEVERTDSQNEEKWFKSITFDEAFTEAYRLQHPGTDYIEITTTVAGLVNGTYVVRESDVIRYRLKEILDVSENGLFQNDGTEVEFDLTGSKMEGYLTFYNIKTTDEGGSDNSLINNIIKMGTKLTGIIVSYSGGVLNTGGTFDREDLEVWAVYDDGTQRELNSDEFDLVNLGLGDVLPGHWTTGDYAVEVSHTDDGGITKSASFVVEVVGDWQYHWTINEDLETATVNRYTGNAGVIYFPSVVTGYWDEEGVYQDDGKEYIVTALEGDAKRPQEAIFTEEQRKTIRIMTLPDQLVSLGDYVFKDSTALNDSLELPSSLVSIGESAFEGCENLVGDLVLYENIREIGENAFSGTKFNGSLEIYAPIAIQSGIFPNTFQGSLVIGDEVQSVASRTFQSTSFRGDLYIGSAADVSGKMTILQNDFSNTFTGSLTIGDRIEAIGASAFYGFSGFSGTLTLGVGVETIGTSAFRNCSGFTGALDLSKNVVNIENYAFNGCSSLSGTLIIADSVGKIGAYAFSDCSQISGLDLGVGAVELTIGTNAFQNCTGLEGELVIPDRVTSIGNTAFSGCNAITAIKMENGTTPLTIGANAFQNCTGLSGMLVIADRVTSIGNYAFAGCSNIQELDLGSGVSTVGDYAFQNCIELERIVELPDITYGSYVFQGCIKLSFDSFELDSMTSIPAYMFQGCTGLAGVIEIEDNITSIGIGAFYGCTNLTGFKIHSGITQLPAYLFYGCTNLGTGTEWGVEDTVTSIGNYAFFGTAYEGTLRIKSHISSIGTYVFGNCTKLTGIDLDGGITAIPAGLFSGCTGFTAISLQPSVTEIGSYAFQNCTNLVSVDWDTVSKVGGYAFRGCTKLETANISNLKEIGTYAFYSCAKLSTGNGVDLNKAETIGARAFYGCTSLNGTLRLNDDMKAVGSYTFYNCRGLSGVLTIPEAATSIGTYAFSGCTGLEGLSMSNNVTSIGNDAFDGCTNMTGPLSLSEGLLTIGNYAFRNCRGFVGGLIIPENVTSIGTYAFDGCSGFDGRLIISESARTIGTYAFRNCSSLEGQLVIPESITSIGTFAFSGCSKIISVEWNTPVTAVSNSMFQNCTSLTDITSILEKATSIGTSAFYGCSSIEGVLVIPESVTSIGASAFYGCSNITSVEWNTPVTAVDNSMFRNCTSLTDITSVLEKATSIGTYAFYGCISIEGALVIPESITTIGTYAFYGCSKITSVEWNTQLKTLDNYVFMNCIGLTDVNSIFENVTSIGNNAFSGCSGLDGILMLSESVVNIGNNAFSGCSGLTGLLMGENVTSIGNNAFSGCSSLDGTLIIPESVVSIGTQAFFNCSSLTGIEWNSELATISAQLFRGCTGLKDINSVLKKVTAIETYAFFGCSGIEGTLVIPENIVNIGTYAFSNCSSIVGVVWDSKVKSVSDNMFQSCTGLTDITSVLDTVTDIGIAAFSGCTGLEGTLNIPDHVTNIGNTAFSGCTGLTGLSIGKNVMSIGTSAFYNCNKLEGTLIIPDHVTIIGSSAFQNCSSLTGLSIGGNVQTIGSYAFRYMYAATGEVKIPVSVTSVGTSAFTSFGNTGGATLLFPTTAAYDFTSSNGFGIGAGRYGTYTP